MPTPRTVTETLNVVNVTYHNYFISKLYELYHVTFTLIIAKSNIYEKNV